MASVERFPGGEQLEQRLMVATTSTPAPLVAQFLPLLRDCVGAKGILDLACGSGRNGLFLARHNLPVVFADINTTALNKVAAELDSLGLSARLWEVDFEEPDQPPLTGKVFDAILVFNYLHRPLIPTIREAVAAGGLLLYETFTTRQASIGRPQNPDYLLQPGELRGWFEDWEILYDFEGADPAPARFYASLAVRKPAHSESTGI
jgi:SAM-dependent methyltransferase